MKKIFITLLVLLISLMVTSQNALAFGIFTGGQTGYDISYPQGSISSLPPSYDFLIIGVTDGRAYTDNPYLSSQVVLAQGKLLSLYINLNAPVGSTVKGNTSSPKTCLKTDKVCQAYNYGYNAASHSYSYSKINGAASPVWWLDIETSNSWSSNKAINDATIQGAVDYLNKTASGATVGIYSTQSMWYTIAGSSFVPTQTTTFVTPNWIPGASSTSPQLACSQTITTNGQAWLTQYVSAGLDHDYACP
jgi:hypothetical protein